MEVLSALEFIVREVIEPAAAQTDNEALYPRKALNALADAGLLGLISAKEVGGMGCGLREAVQDMARDHAEIRSHSETPWASATFSGGRHRLECVFSGLQAIAAGEGFIDALPDHEFALPGQIVVEIENTGSTRGSLWTVSSPVPRFGLFLSMVANLSKLNCLPFLPTRGWR